MKTLKELKDRCIIDSETGCWIWKGAVSKGNAATCGLEGYPTIYGPNYNKDPSGKTMGVQPGRRVAFQIKHKRAIAEGMRITKRPECSHLCVNPDHMAEQDVKAHGEEIAKSGKWKGVPARIIANRTNPAGIRSRGLTPEQVAEVLASTEKHTVIARRLGVSVHPVFNVRSGKSRYGMLTNPFSGLIR